MHHKKCLDLLKQGYGWLCENEAFTLEIVFFPGLQNQRIMGFETPRSPSLIACISGFFMIYVFQSSYHNFSTIQSSWLLNSDESKSLKEP
jgi:hypothetical protein